MAYDSGNTIAKVDTDPQLQAAIQNRSEGLHNLRHAVTQQHHCCQVVWITHKR